MDSKITSSFIPDKALARDTSPAGLGRVPQGGLGDMALLLGIVMLAVALALSAGVFLYDRFLASNVSAKNAQLAKAREQFDPLLIQDLLRLDARLNAGADILARHLAPTEVFALLQTLTLQSIAYDSLEYTIGDDGIIHIAMDGIAQSVNGVALQSSVFGDNYAIVNPIFSNLDLGNKGVSFHVDAILDPLALQYALVAQKRAAASSAPQPPTTTTTSEETLDPFSGDVTPTSTTTPQ